MLLGALAFQHLGGMAPCKLCIWQRWPHGIAIVIGVLALALPGPVLPVLGLLAALATAGVGVYHTGVERGWWEGPTTCTSGSISGLSTEELLDQIMNAPLVRCDDIVWQMFGLTMANLNSIFSFVFALLWIRVALSRD